MSHTATVPFPDDLAETYAQQIERKGVEGFAQGCRGHLP